MTPETTINGTTHELVAGAAKPAAQIVAAPRQLAPPARRMVAVLRLPNGDELFMRESTSGWTVIEYGNHRKSDAPAVRRSDLTLLRDIAAAYGFAPHGEARARFGKGPALTLVSSR